MFDCNLNNCKVNVTLTANLRKAKPQFVSDINCFPMLLIEIDLMERAMGKGCEKLFKISSIAEYERALKVVLTFFKIDNDLNV